MPDVKTHRQDVLTDMVVWATDALGDAQTGLWDWDVSEIYPHPYVFWVRHVEHAVILKLFFHDRL